MHAFINVCDNVFLHACIVHSCIHVCMHPSIHPFMHACMHHSFMHSNLTRTHMPRDAAVTHRDTEIERLTRLFFSFFFCNAHLQSLKATQPLQDEIERLTRQNAHLEAQRQVCVCVCVSECVSV